MFAGKARNKRIEDFGRDLFYAESGEAADDPYGIANFIKPQSHAEKSEEKSF